VPNLSLKTAIGCGSYCIYAQLYAIARQLLVIKEFYMLRTILSQGIFESSCLIYSIMNAYKTLFYPEMSIIEFRKSWKIKWENIISMYPRANDMIAGHAFPDYIFSLPMNINNQWDIVLNETDHILKTAFIFLSDDDHKISFNKINIDSIINFDYSNSVILLSITNEVLFLSGNKIKEHWICLNGSTEDKIHIVCSYSINNIDQDKYNEYFDDKTRRYYNNMIKTEDINETNLDKAVNAIYKITRAK
jgi:hypothetical protein